MQLRKTFSLFVVVFGLLYIIWQSSWTLVVMKNAAGKSGHLDVNYAIEVLRQLQSDLESPEIRDDLERSINLIKSISYHGRTFSMGNKEKNSKREIKPYNIGEYPDSKAVEIFSNTIQGINKEKLSYNPGWTNTSAYEYDSVYSGEVCPETIKGYRLKGECATENSKRISQLVTIVLNFQTYKTYKEIVNQTLFGIKQMFEEITVFVAVISKEEIPDYRNVQMFLVSENETSGMVWNQLIQKVTTRYVFIGRDLVNFNNDISLERFIREMYPLKLDIVGGAIRTASNGHWSHGCYQTVYKNYTLIYKLGYHRSAHDCLFCHYIHSPFLARTEFMIHHDFDTSLNDSILFYNYFVELFKQKAKIGVCPDNMFNVRDEVTKILTREEWLPVAMERKLTKISPPEGPTWQYTCAEVGIKITGRVGYAHPSCLIQHMADHILFVLNMCEKVGLYCELSDGTLLGAVKLSRVPLWDVDSDLVFYGKDSSIWETIAKNFTAAGYRLEKKPYNYLPYRSHNKYAYCRLDLFKRNITGNMFEFPTKVLFHGQWVNAPRNVGRYLRKKYGPDIYRHKQHSTQQRGHVGSFTPCNREGEHNCLDNFEIDGNIQFDEIVV